MTVFWFRVIKKRNC